MFDVNSEKANRILFMNVKVIQIFALYWCMRIFLFFFSIRAIIMSSKLNYTKKIYYTSSTGKILERARVNFCIQYIRFIY